MPVQDTNYATRWLKLHAGEFNGDASSLGAIGYSSGGHTVPLAAMRPDDPRYNELPLEGSDSVDGTLAWMAACWPVIDPYDRYLIAQKNQQRRVGRTPQRLFPG